MSNQLPISPHTGQPSGLTAMIRKSVGIQDGGAPVAEQARPTPFQQKYQPGLHPVETPNLRAAVRRSVGIVDSPPAQPVQQAQVQRGPTANELAQAITAAVVQMLGPALQQLSQAQQAMVTRAAHAAPAQPMVVRASTYGPDYATPLPTPPQGPQPGQQRLYVYDNPPRGPAGMANACVIQGQQGPAQIGLTAKSYATPGARSVREIVRAGMGLPY